MRVAIPALVYVELERDSIDECLSAASKLRAHFDDDGRSVTEASLAGLYPEIRFQMDAAVLWADPMTMPQGLQEYHVVLLLSYGDPASHAEAEDAQEGEYEFDVKARNSFEAEELARDEFADTYAIDDLDDVTIECCSVRRSGMLSPA